MAGIQRGFRTRLTFLSTFNRESHYPIFSALCNCLSIASIVSLTRTCKELSGLYQYLLLVQWDVDKALGRYVDDPPGFRSQMARCDALIDGDFSLHYFERTQGDCEPLDVSIQQGSRVELFSKYLLDIAGYSELERKQHGEIFDTIESRTFKRMANNKTVIGLHVTKSTPIQSVLFTNTTTKLNFLSWNKAYSVFPLPTFVQYKSYLLQSLDDEDARLAAQFDSRGGWKVQGVMWPEETHDNHPIRERRRIGDRFTWTIPFDTRKVEWSKTPDYILEYTCFAMDQVSDNNNGNPNTVGCHTIEANTLESKVLKHTYLCGDVRMREFIFRRLHTSIILELRMLDPAQQPANYSQIMLLGQHAFIDDALEDFDRPASWRYRDDEFPEWCEAFEKKSLTG